MNIMLPALLATPPNILILLTDDQGWGDNEYNCDNSTGLCALTPAIAALAKSPHTALFHRFYAAASVCSPTRAAILTGRTNNRDCIDSALPCCRLPNVQESNLLRQGLSCYSRAGRCQGYGRRKKR